MSVATLTRATSDNELLLLAHTIYRHMEHYETPQASKLLISFYSTALKESRALYVPDGNPEIWAEELDRRIRQLEIRLL